MTLARRLQIIKKLPGWFLERRAKCRQRTACALSCAFLILCVGDPRAGCSQNEERERKGIKKEEALAVTVHIC